jgi:hypothetical protein
VASGGSRRPLESVIVKMPLEPHVAFAELGQVKLDEGDLHAVLRRVAELARQTLPARPKSQSPLNIYAAQPAAFHQETIELAWTFAGYAAVAIANAHLYQVTATLAENMRKAMETRAVIEQAKGIIVAQQHCTPEHAFELLSRLSQSTHRKLRDCAADLVTSTAEGTSRSR